MIDLDEIRRYLKCESLVAGVDKLPKGHVRIETTFRYHTYFGDEEGNPGSVVIPFDTAAYKADVDPGDTILNLASRLAAYGGGGTDCSLPLAEANTTYRDRRFAVAAV